MPDAAATVRPRWRLIDRVRDFRVRHMLGEWWVSAFLLRERFGPELERESGGPGGR